MNRNAFTLIELLVVVLIIGILAGVALPQYRKAVYKSRATEAMNMLRAIANAQEVYYMATGDYTNDLSALDIEIPARGSNDTYRYYCIETRTCFAWAADSSLPAFEFCLQNKDNYGNAGKFYCQVSESNRNNTAKQICQSLGREDVVFGNNYAHNAGKYFILN